MCQGWAWRQSGPCFYTSLPMVRVKQSHAQWDPTGAQTLILSQACNWYLSEEKGGPCLLQSCWEMEGGRRAHWDSEGICLWGIKLMYVAFCFVFMHLFLLSWLWTTMVQLYFIAWSDSCCLVTSKWCGVTTAIKFTSNDTSNDSIFVFFPFKSSKWIYYYQKP